MILPHRVIVLQLIYSMGSTQHFIERMQRWWQGFREPVKSLFIHSDNAGSHFKSSKTMNFLSRLPKLFGWPAHWSFGCPGHGKVLHTCIHYAALASSTSQHLTAPLITSHNLSASLITSHHLSESLSTSQHLSESLSTSQNLSELQMP